MCEKFAKSHKNSDDSYSLDFVLDGSHQFSLKFNGFESLKDLKDFKFKCSNTDGHRDVHLLFRSNYLYSIQCIL